MKIDSATWKENQAVIGKSRLQKTIDSLVRTWCDHIEINKACNCLIPCSGWSKQGEENVFFFNTVGGGGICWCGMKACQHKCFFFQSVASFSQPAQETITFKVKMRCCILPCWHQWSGLVLTCSFPGEPTQSQMHTWDLLQQSLPPNSVERRVSPSYGPAWTATLLQTERDRDILRTEE